MSYHDLETVGGIHVVCNWEFANTTARLAESVTAEDVGKFAWQKDDNSVWLLAADTPTWISITTGAAEDADHLILAVRKGSSGTISKGKPVYASGYNASGWVEVEEADADDPAKMPCIGLAETDITNTALSNVVVYGLLGGLDTSSLSFGNPLYISATAGTLTATRPTGATTAIQKVGSVLRAHVSSGEILVSGANRANDVPNMANGKIWKGDSNGHPQEVDFAHGGLSGIGTDNHHARDHAGTHGPGAQDALKLDDLAAPDDNVDLNVSTSAHGLAPKLPDDAAKYLNGQGAYTVPAGGSSTFEGLTDTPSSYTGEAGKFPQVNSGEDALEFVTAGVLSKIFEALDDTGGLTISNTAQAIPLGNENQKDNYYTHSETVSSEEVIFANFTGTKKFKIDARVTVAAVDTSLGIRGNPVLELQLDTGSGYSALPIISGGYIREDTGQLSTNISFRTHIDVEVGDKIRMVVRDTVTAEPNEATVADGSSLIIEFVDRTGTGGASVNNLSDVGDVDAAAPSENDHLVYNGSSEWENRAYPEYHGAITKTAMEALTSPSIGDWCICTTFEGKRFNFDGQVWVIPGEVVRVENRTGGTRIEGDVVVLDGTYARAVNVTTSLDNINILGAVVSGGITGSGNYISVAIAGLPWKVNINGSAGLGDGLFTYTTAAQAYASATASPGSFGQTIASKGVGIALLDCWIKSKEIY